MEKLPLRREIDRKYRWRLEDLYETDARWEEDLARMPELIARVSGFRGTLKESGVQIAACFRAQDDLGRTIERLFVYARMRRDEDNANPVYQDMTGKAELAYTQTIAALSFIEPELLAAGWEAVDAFLAQTPELREYQFILEQMFRLKDHVLSAEVEQVLAHAREATGAGDDIFNMFNNADIKFPHIEDEQGRSVELTKGRYTMFLESKDRNVRKQAFQALYQTYGAYRNTLAACLAGSVKSDRFYAETRHYLSCLEAALSADNVPVSVYDSLIETIHKNLGRLGDYLQLRQEALQISPLHMYDLYTPMVSLPRRTYTYEEAAEIVQEALKPLGAEYCNALKQAFTDGWIDVCENQGKTSGAYSWGCYGCHPYVLLNWQGTINDVFTLAHELGHAMHSYYSNATQPYQYAEYKIFVAEVASTVNENLLIRYLLRITEAKEERAYLLNHYLEEFRGTVFRQTMFAEFERMIHGKAEAGETLTCDDLCAVYYDLNKQYFGKHVSVDREIALEWARIPHFYNAFYVYKYATGFSAAAALAQGILQDADNALPRYLTFLKSGGSRYPMDLLKAAGVDLSSPAPVQEALDLFEENLKSLEELIRAGTC